MYSTLYTHYQPAVVADEATRAATHRRARRAQHAERATVAETIAIRRATADDAGAVVRLAQLDSAPAPTGDVLVAEIDGEIAAAVPVSGGRAIADPFRPTLAVLDLLRRRAAQLQA